MKDYGLKCPKCGSKLLCGDAEQSSEFPDFYIINSPVCINYKECGTIHVKYWVEKDKVPTEIIA